MGECPEVIPDESGREIVPKAGSRSEEDP